MAGREFDGDFLLRLVEDPDWATSPSSYIDQVYYGLDRHSVYSGMPHRRKYHCVRVVYANFCHIDIVPYLVLDGGRQVIVNRDEDRWEDTNPAGFTQWMKDKDAIIAGNLRRVIRLLKYLRDRRGHFEGTRSIVLTTLVGGVIDPWKKLVDPGYYATVPDALVRIVGDLDVWLQGQIVRPTILDPSGSGLTFDHRWSDESFVHFRDRIHTFAAEMADAYNEARPGNQLSGCGRTSSARASRLPRQKETSGRFGPVVPVTPRSGLRRLTNRIRADPERVAATHALSCGPLPPKTRATVAIVAENGLEDDGFYRSTIRLPTGELPAADGGMPVHQFEDVEVSVADTALVPPQVAVDETDSRASPMFSKAAAYAFTWTRHGSGNPVRDVGVSRAGVAILRRRRDGPVRPCRRPVPPRRRGAAPDRGAPDGRRPGPLPRPHPGFR